MNDKDRKEIDNQESTERNAEHSAEVSFLQNVWNKVWGLIQSYINPSVPELPKEEGSAYDIFDGDGEQFKSGHHFDPDEEDQLENDGGDHSNENKEEENTGYRNDR